MRITERGAGESTLVHEENLPLSMVCASSSMEITLEDKVVVVCQHLENEEKYPEKVGKHLGYVHFTMRMDTSSNVNGNAEVGKDFDETSI